MSLVKLFGRNILFSAAITSIFLLAAVCIQVIFALIRYAIGELGPVGDFVMIGLGIIMTASVILTGLDIFFAKGRE